MELNDFMKQNAEEKELIEKIDYLSTKLQQTCSNEEEQQFLLEQLENALDQLMTLKKKKSKLF